MLHGVDLSTFQRDVNYPELARAVAFAYCKATDANKPDGVHWVPFTDPMHEKHVVALRDVGLPTGSYAFGHPTQDVNACADYFVAHAWYDQLRPVIDMEALAAGDKVPDNAGEWTEAWCVRVEAGTGTKPIIYSSSSYAQTMIQQCPALKDRDFWIAAYPGGPQIPPDHMPKVAGLPPGRILAWQWTGTGTLPGIKGNADRDVAPSLEPLYVVVPDLPAT